MCGIAGIVSLSGVPIPPESLKAMCDIQAHRGPDDAGYLFVRPGIQEMGEGGYWVNFCDPQFAHRNEHLPAFGGDFSRREFQRNVFGVALGHRRLSIIDLSPAGHQPMPNSDRRLWVTYNGELYNFPELRRCLLAKGHIFQSQSDTEVLLHLWEESGPQCLEQLNGMFALAMYDRSANLLTLARDRFGVKPLYFAFTDDFLLFASEIKGILASDLIRPAISPPSVVEYCAFQNLFGDSTLFEGVRILRPGERLSVTPLGGRRVEPERYFAGFPACEPDFDTALARERVVEAFAQAVKRQLVSDVEVGSYLSGGMDSGSIVSVAGRCLGRLHTFTGGFDLTNVNGIEQGFDERNLAERLSYLLQTEHYAVVLHSGDMPAAMEKIAWHMDDPRVGMCHQNWYVAKLASRFVKVCLAGTGGDELFGGYPWRYLRAAGAGGPEEFDRLYFDYWHRLLPQEALPRLVAGDLHPFLGRPAETFAGIMRGAPAIRQDLSLLDNLLNRALHFEFATFLHGLLITEDRMSMAHSLETRVPFMDNDLVDLAWRLPARYKVSPDSSGKPMENGCHESSAGKRILREAMEEYLPQEFTRQPKQGFSPPDENWYRGPSMDYIKSILLDPRSLGRPWFDNDFVLARLEEHFQGRHNHRLLIWSLLSFEWLQRHFVDEFPRGNRPCLF